MASLLTTFLAAFILAYVLRPVYLRLISLRSPSALAAISTIILALASILGLFALIVTVLQSEIPLIREQLPAWLTHLQNNLQPYIDKLALKIDLAQTRELIQTKISQQLSENANTLINSSLSALLASTQSILSGLVNFLLIIFVMFYLLTEWDHFLEKIQHIVPRKSLETTNTIAREIDELLSQYLRGQLIVIIYLAIYYCVALSILDITGALALGLFTGIAVFIPYIGFALGFILALLSAILQAESAVPIIGVLIIFGLGQLIESLFLTPKFVGERIGLHPVLVVFALILFGSWFGFFGILLALPLSAILLVLTRHGFERYQQSSWYRNK
ncbi:MAG: AI-2E family transporter [Burkholderiaceae bacterium]|jgi:predicted PurR-regulated permease PerM|uniref:AI-2E family transporter n=1 Tax=Polynucleobacter sp. MWH-Loch1C5 TaxID=2689108 RepID=UPI001C0D931E|nr:AI-2E family transporter [Polynucleobacter sp. MWH-Loch1C5]MBU3542758.1 AI-2E family transporter [Polynucleobacter sp. MWH-Loch1C5]NBV00350.1 AI-2E family transporter [Burkholderiaceae bacterium]